MFKPGFMSYEQYKEHDELGNAPHLLSEEDRKKLDDGKMIRAGGGCICEACGKEYYDHPSVMGALWATKLCDGSLVKL